MYANLCAESQEKGKSEKEMVGTEEEASTHGSISD